MAKSAFPPLHQRTQSAQIQNTTVHSHYHQCDNVLIHGIISRSARVGANHDVIVVRIKTRIARIFYIGFIRPCYHGSHDDNNNNNNKDKKKSLKTTVVKKLWTKISIQWKKI